MVKIVHLNSYDNIGGAARAAFRLHKGLQSVGVDSTMLVQSKASNDYTVSGQPANWQNTLRPLINKLPLFLYPKRERGNFSPSVLPDSLSKRVDLTNADIINFHWVTDGFMRIETVSKFSKPLVWTLHDMWPFTGGCHYNEECVNYENNCGLCPQLGSNKQNDLSRSIWKRKNNAWGELNITVVSPSQWLASCTSSSTLFRDCRIEVIPHGLDMKIFKPLDKSQAREILAFPKEKGLILFGAANASSDKRKGFNLLTSALNKLSGRNKELEVVVFGSTKPPSPPNFGLKTHYAGCLHDDTKLALLYSAADLMVVPSTQEAFGQTASESLACGTPVVAFAATGLLDIVEHKINGYLAKPFDTDDLAMGIAWVLEDEDRAVKLNEAAREKAVREYSLEMQAKRYLHLYEELLANG